MEPKKWTKAVLGAATAILLILMALNAVIDPFVQYHSPLPALEPYYTFSQEYAMYWLIGRARHTPAEGAVLGSSLSNFISSNKLSQLSGKKIVPLKKSMGRPDVYTLFLRESFKRNRLQIVYYEITFPHLSEKYPEEIPRYLYNSNPFDDVKYLLNKEVLGMSTYIVSGWASDALDTNHKKQRERQAWNRELFEVDRTQLSSHYSTLTVARSLYVRHNKVADKHSVIAYRANASEAVEKNIIPFLEKYPHTRFVFIVPCISILNTYDQVREGTAGDYLGIYKDLMLRLLQYDNAEIHMFSDVEGFVDNLDNYKDRVHYCPAGGDLIIDGLKSGKYRITPQNIDQRLAHQKALAERFQVSFLKEGFKGEDVLALNRQLIALGYDCPATVEYDKRTTAAVARFQADYHLPVTGIATADTQALLQELSRQTTDPHSGANPRRSSQ